MSNSRRVQWSEMRSPIDWGGSTITWDLAPIATGTKLLFSQRDVIMGPSDYSVEQTRAGWVRFLLSLKSYLEAGKGTPYV
jgi:hypothetical protein